MSTLHLINLRKQFGAVANPVVAVNDLNLKVEDGEFLCILGPSGCGKSTALRMVAGFEEPSSGDVQIDGQSVINMPANKRPTAMVFQKYTLWPHMRVYDNIAFGLRLRHLPKQQIDRDVRDALALVHLDEYGDRYPAQLSGGEQQRGHRPRPCPAPQDPAAGRALLQPRRAAPGAPARGTPLDPAQPQNHRGLCHPRSGGGPQPGRSHRRDAQG
ncbi:MAG: ABC transporter ATP-binding protein [Anaerolineae bacterium]|nr:ABC transporter ATP-binding protein [Anaerolineae bacterium]